MACWVPMESNPEVMTKFLHKLGVPRDWSIVDVYGLDPDLLGLVPKPVLAVILLYPLSSKVSKSGNGLECEEDDKEKDSHTSIDPDVFYMKQYIHNACGTIALIHSVANNQDIINLEDGFLKTFLDGAKNQSFTECGKLLMESDDISYTHKVLAQEGQTEVPSVEVAVYHHFVAFVHKNGQLYELGNYFRAINEVDNSTMNRLLEKSRLNFQTLPSLDGRKSGPINHGATTPGTLLEDAARVCKDYMARDPEEVCFTVLALVNSDAAALYF